MFYSEDKPSIAGNFFTDKRIASYWVDDRERTVESAYYSEIISIDTVFNAGATYCPYMLVTRWDSSSFKVCVEGNHELIQAFFEDAIKLWLQKKQPRSSESAHLRNQIQVL